MLLIKRKKMSELEQAHAMKQAERGSEEEEVQQQQPNKIMDYFFSNRSPLTGRYKRFRADWMVMHPGLAFEDISEFFVPVMH